MNCEHADIETSSNNDVSDYLEQMYWEGKPTVQSECCGGTINEFTTLMVLAHVIPSTCPTCGEACSFQRIVGPASHPISITYLEDECL
jgi:hypothetical protein